MNDLALVLYTFFLWLYRIAATISSLFNVKAKKWVQGRKNIFSRLENAIGPSQKTVWVHCASLGEFEQGRPVLEKIKKDYPGYKLLLTFFSPSGYEIQKNYPGADWICYLPLDGRRNARRFLEIVQPSLVVFVKYEFWYFYLKEINARKIPLLLISGIFRENSVFFKWYGGLHRKMLRFFHHLFLQDNNSAQLLRDHDVATPYSVTGDTRFDRVTEIAERFEPIPAIERFVGSEKVIVAGSTWRKDEEIFSRYIKEYNNKDYKYIIAPHEIDNAHLNDLKKLFPDSVRYSDYINSPDKTTSDVLIIDNIGMLSQLYKYATVAFIGGGFSGGIHNTLEAAVYGKPLMFGPKYRKHYEAVQLVEKRGAISVKDYEEFDINIDIIAFSKEAITDMSRKSKGYVMANKGATQKILNYIQENRLLTN